LFCGKYLAVLTKRRKEKDEERDEVMHMFV